MSRAVRSGTRVVLPPGVEPPFEVFVSSVRQREGVDYRVEGGELVFARELRQEGTLGFWRWTSIFFGVAGTYRQNDVVDVAYTRDGRRAVAASLPVEP